MRGEFIRLKYELMKDSTGVGNVLRGVQESTSYAYLTNSTSSLPFDDFALIPAATLHSGGRGLFLFVIHHAIRVKHKATILLVGKRHKESKGLDTLDRL